MNMVVAGSAIVFWFVALAGGLYWGRRYVRAIESQSTQRDRVAALEARLASLEAARQQLRPLLPPGSPGSTGSGPSAP